MTNQERANQLAKRLGRKSTDIHGNPINPAHEANLVRRQGAAAARKRGGSVNPYHPDHEHHTHYEQGFQEQLERTQRNRKQDQSTTTNYDEE